MIATKPKSKQLVNAVAYYRMSSDKQEASIPAQRGEVERLAERRGYKIIREYVDEGISGDDTAKRKQFQAMIADADRGEFSAILCWDQDRFGRFDSIEAGRWIHPLREAGVCLETVAQGRTDWTDFAGRMIYGITQEGKNAFLRDLSRNVVRGHLSKAKQGLWQGGKPPFGYAVQDQRLVVDADQAAVRRAIER
jgi:site-specific DNA recombinase